jgi:aldehyde dehydrogenase (NAD+)
VLERFAVALEARVAETARRVSVQNGMPLWLAQTFEAGFPALLLRYYAGLVAAGQEEVRAGMLGKKSLIRREPIGVVAAIVPWNVPQAISFLKLGRALAVDNTVVLKSAPEIVLDAFLMAEAAQYGQSGRQYTRTMPGISDPAVTAAPPPGVGRSGRPSATTACRVRGDGTVRACGIMVVTGQQA